MIDYAARAREIVQSRDVAHCCCVPDEPPCQACTMFADAIEAALRAVAEEVRAAQRHEIPNPRQPLTLASREPQAEARETVSDDELRALLSPMDGAAWANAFARMTGLNEAAALPWFCSAIMAGFDEANRRRDRELAGPPVPPVEKPKGAAR